MYSAFAGETQRRKTVFRIDHWASSHNIIFPSFDLDLF